MVLLAKVCIFNFFDNSIMTSLDKASVVHIHHHHYNTNSPEGAGILDDMNRALNPRRNGVAKAFDKFGRDSKRGLQKTGDVLKQVANDPTVQAVGKQVGKTLLKQALNTGMNMVAPELAGTASPLINQGVNSIVGNGLGLGLKPKKGSPEMAEKMARLRAMRKGKK
jgi:hypothetical protein